MITERMAFQAKYGRGDELVAWMKDLFTSSAAVREGVLSARVYTDFTGTMFTVVAEADYDSLDTMVAANKKQMAEWSTPDFQERFGKMMELVERGDRQILNCERII